MRLPLSKLNAATERCVSRRAILRVVLDTCVLKLATLPGAKNYAALIVDLVLRGRLEAFVSPAILEEYGDVLIFRLRPADIFRPAPHCGVSP